MTTRPNKPQRKPMPDPPEIWHPSIEEAPHLYEDGIYFPESDGMPLPDALEQEREYVDVNVTLRGHFVDQPNTFVSGNTFVYYDRRNARHNVSPDCYVAFDVDVAALYEANRYRVWAVGKPPDFALEIGSSSTASNDLILKRETYATIGIGEYWRYDPTDDSRNYGEPLVGEWLVGDQYQRLPVAPDADGRPRGYSPTLGLDLVWENGVLRFYDPATGEWLRTYDEEREAREAAEARANAAQEARAAAEARANAAQEAREAAEARADASRAAKEAFQARAAAAEAELEQLREQLRRQQEE